MSVATAELEIEGPGFSLTPEQKAAVEWADGPLMVLAGAGTGKTTVVVERVRHLLATDTSLLPENILVLTYNVRAAAELMERLEQQIGLEVASRLWVYNFHSFGNRILSDHRAELGLAENADVVRQDEDVFRAQVPLSGEQVPYALDNDRCLPRPRPGQHHERALTPLNCGALVLRQLEISASEIPVQNPHCHQHQG